MCIRDRHRAEQEAREIGRKLVDHVHGMLRHMGGQDAQHMGRAARGQPHAGPREGDADVERLAVHHGFDQPIAWRIFQLQVERLAVDTDFIAIDHDIICLLYTSRCV